MSETIVDMKIMSKRLELLELKIKEGSYTFPNLN